MKNLEITITRNSLESYKKAAVETGVNIVLIEDEEIFENLSWEGISRQDHKIVRNFAQKVKTGNLKIKIELC